MKYEKKILLFAVAALMMVGCSGVDESDADGFETIVVDSCEYLYEEVPTTGGPFAAMAHKGNCRFCKERRKQELKGLVKQLKEK